MSLPDVTILGDPHLGKRFKTGVPLHRVGDREAAQQKVFRTSLGTVSTPFHVNMGDLFDQRIVSPEIVLRAAGDYGKVAILLPDTTFVVLMGNHDVSRNADQASSFDLFEALVSGYRNIVVVKDEPRVLEGYGFVPFSAFRPTTDLVDQLPDDLTAVFGHWDIQDWGGDNVIPTALLAKKGITLAVSGHDHLAREETRNGVKIIVTGSMQPFTHAEDPNGDLYVTTGLPIEGDVTNKNVRVILKPGETLPADLDCLSLTGRRESVEKMEVDTSEFDSLDLGEMLGSALDGLSVKDEIMGAFANAD